jgi:GT2 family glycosyltransferase
MNLTVVICTHNPKPVYLDQVLGSLRSQTVGPFDWNLLVVDNRSDAPLAGRVDLSWHPGARCVREEELGSLPARLCGIREASGELILFVDDDNVLAADYIEQGLSLAARWPRLGAFGGQILPRFDVAPPEWTRPYWRLLDIRELQSDLWSNLDDQLVTVPATAGMFIRSQVARAHATKVEQDAIRRLLGRKGDSLQVAEDMDMALTACDLGLGCGLFRQLELAHLLPPARLEEAYLLRLEEATEYSAVLLGAIRSPLARSEPGWLRWIWRRLGLLRCPVRERRFQLARERGREMARRFLRARGVVG